MSEAQEPFNVLFLGSRNSDRSIMAEALLNRLGRGRFKAFSAGSSSKGEIDPHALAVIGGLGFDPAGFRSKSWDEFAGPDAPHMDFIVTVCDDAAGEISPDWPGHPVTAHWSIDDPARASGTPTQIALAYSDAARQVRNRVTLMVELPVEKLARTLAHHELSNIHRTADAAEAQASG
jgi:arsenate reductase (thioredoxin)